MAGLWRSVVFKTSGAGWRNQKQKLNRSRKTMLQTAKTSAPSFQALVAANRAAGRLAESVAPEPKEKMKQTGMRLWPAELNQATELAAQEDRSAASFMRRIYLRGLEGYMAERGQATSAQ